MATYAELVDLLSPGGDQGLRRKVAVATLIAADAIRQEADAATVDERERKRFSQRLLNALINQSLYLNQLDEALALSFERNYESVYKQVIIQNKGATVAQITGATDAQIQTNVDAAITHLAKGYPDPVTP